MNVQNGDFHMQRLALLVKIFSPLHTPVLLPFYSIMIDIELSFAYCAKGIHDAVL